MHACQLNLQLGGGGGDSFLLKTLLLYKKMFAAILYKGAKSKIISLFFQPKHLLSQ